ncbi:MAG: hypothetical protein HXM94_00805 [Parvimonas micra]|uniref:Uncharacterized protein n=1 Tax=Parvimonas micra TaxID=33033 RepID=A0A930DY06_9FIRM|nr:hypothetical protein [Parvimonas micra]MBF1306314.1 hypothetical protein [Parvimonas micra]
MKRFWIKLGIVLTLIIAFVGGNYWAFKIGWWEKTLSTTVIPFQFLRSKESQSLAGMAVKAEGNRSAEKVKEELKPFTDLFSVDKIKRPAIDKAGFSSESLAKLEKILDPIYGIDYQYIGKASVSGWIQTNKGWNPILTLSIYNDTSYINNYSMELYKGESGWEIGEVISETQDLFAYPELDNSFNFSYIDLSISQDEKFVKNKLWESYTSSLDPEVLNLLKGNYQNLISKVVYFEYSTTVKSYRSFNTPTGIKQVVREQLLDNVNSPLFDLKMAS